MVCQTSSWFSLSLCIAAVYRRALWRFTWTGIVWAALESRRFLHFLVQKLRSLVLLYNWPTFGFLPCWYFTLFFFLLWFFSLWLHLLSELCHYLHSQLSFVLLKFRLTLLNNILDFLILPLLNSLGFDFLVRLLFFTIKLTLHAFWCKSCLSVIYDPFLLDTIHVSVEAWEQNHLAISHHCRLPQFWLWCGLLSRLGWQTRAEDHIVICLSV